MFWIDRKIEAGFEKVILKNDLTGNYAVILPQCCAMLHEFVVLQDGSPVNVIDSYLSYQEFKEDLIAKGFKGCKLSPFVCRVNQAQYTFGGKEYFIEKSLPASHALHGELYDKPFVLLDESASEAGAQVSMIYEYRSEDPGYPFDYDCLVTWSLEAGNRLSVTTKCVNRDKGLIPLQDGWHPYFSLGESIDELHLEFQAIKKVEFNSDLIPTGKLTPYPKFNSIEKIGDTVLDNCFVLDTQECQPLCVLRNVEKNIEVRFFPDPSYPYLQIYTPPHRRSIAIENVSGAPNAFNNGMGVITLESGQSATFHTTYQILLK